MSMNFSVYVNNERVNGETPSRSVIYDIDTFSYE